MLLCSTPLPTQSTAPSCLFSFLHFLYLWTDDLYRPLSTSMLTSVPFIKKPLLSSRKTSSVSNANKRTFWDQSDAWTRERTFVVCNTYLISKLWRHLLLPNAFNKLCKSIFNLESLKIRDSKTQSSSCNKRKRNDRAPLLAHWRKLHSQRRQMNKAFYQPLISRPFASLLTPQQTPLTSLMLSDFLLRRIQEGGSSKSNELWYSKNLQVINHRLTNKKKTMKTFALHYL